MGGQSFECQLCGKWFLSKQGRNDHERHCAVQQHARVVPAGPQNPPAVGLAGKQAGVSHDSAKAKGNI